MSGAVIVDLDGPLTFSPFDIPGSSPPVKMALLRDEPERRARTLLVEFPAGFRRSGPGCYVASEEMVVLSGSLHMSGLTFSAGEWGYVPPFASRVDTIADEPVLVFARFGGPAKWLPGEGEATSFERFALSDFAALGHAPSPVGEARVLRHGEADSAWLLESAPSGAAPCDMELLSASDHHWAFVPNGSVIPKLDGPLFCRTFA